MIEVIYRHLLAKVLAELFDEKNRKELLRLVKEIVTEIKSNRGVWESIFEFDSVSICKELTTFSNGKSSHYSLCFKNWEGSCKIVPVPDNKSIKRLMEDEDYIVKALVFREMLNKHNKLNNGGVDDVA